MSKIVNRKDIGEIMDVSQQTISEWLAKDMPVLDRGAAFVDGAYDTGACIRWRINQELARAERERPRDRLDLANARLREQELELRSGKLVEASAVRNGLGRLVIEFRSALLRIATDQSFSDVVRQQLEERHRAILKELSEYDPAILTAAD